MEIAYPALVFALMLLGVILAVTLLVLMISAIRALNAYTRSRATAIDQG